MNVKLYLEWNVRSVTWFQGELRRVLDLNRELSAALSVAQSRAAAAVSPLESEDYQNNKGSTQQLEAEVKNKSAELDALQDRVRELILQWEGQAEVNTVPRLRCKMKNILVFSTCGETFPLRFG